MKARIFRPTRTAMQSGMAKTRVWRLEFVQSAANFIDPLMGWNGMRDTTQEVQLTFNSEEAATDYAKRNAIDYEIAEPETRVIKPKSYAANFSFKKVEQ